MSQAAVTQAEQVRYQLTDYMRQHICTEMVHPHHLFSHAIQLSLSAFNAAGGRWHSRREADEAQASAIVLWVTETLAGTLHAPSVFSSTSISPVIKANGCCDNSRPKLATYPNFIIIHPCFSRNVCTMWEAGSSFSSEVYYSPIDN